MQYLFLELQNYNLGRNFINRDGEKKYYNYSINQAKEEGLTIMSLEEFLHRYKESRNIKLFLEIKESKINNMAFMFREEIMDIISFF